MSHASMSQVCPSPSTEEPDEEEEEEEEEWERREGEERKRNQITPPCRAGKEKNRCLKHITSDFTRSRPRPSEFLGFFTEYPKASPLLPAPLAVAVFLVSSIAAWQNLDRLLGLLACQVLLLVFDSLQ